MTTAPSQPPSLILRLSDDDDNNDDDNDDDDESDTLQHDRDRQTGVSPSHSSASVRRQTGVIKGGRCTGGRGGVLLLLHDSVFIFKCFGSKSGCKESR